ncbi:hypothetical protein [Tsukamurella pulmonis]|uniref:hypothetical protein n=1 Tax=Tsukamurella pulmonis TaxID=47312 RepID=UPI0014039527|nr:hypothetical protein [Tsukamurella pulmonis]
MQPLPSQVAMLRLTAQHPQGRTLVIDAAWRTAAPVETADLVRAAQEALFETEAAAIGAEPVPGGGVRLVPTAPAPVAVHDVADEDDLRRWRVSGTLALDGSPLVRVAIVRCAGDHVLRVLAHHAVLDGYGVTLIVRRILERLEALGAGRPLPLSRLGDLAALTAASAPLRDPDPAFWAAATEGVGRPGHEIALAERTGAPAESPLQYRLRIPAAAFRARRSWPAEAAATVAAYVARYLGTEAAHVGVTAALRSTDLERATPTYLVAVVPTRLHVPDGATPVSLAADLKSWLGAAVPRIAAGERPEQLLASTPAGWRTGRLYGPVVNVVPFAGVAGWSLDIVAWGPVSDSLITVHPGSDDDLLVVGVFHPELYDADGAAAHVEAIAALLSAALADPAAPLPPIAAKPVAPDRVPIPGGWVTPAGLRAALGSAGFAAEQVNLRLETPVTVELIGAGPERLPQARAVLPPGVRVRCG